MVTSDNYQKNQHDITWSVKEKIHTRPTLSARGCFAMYSGRSPPDIHSETSSKGAMVAPRRGTTFGCALDGLTALHAMGHTTEVVPDLGEVHAIAIDPATGMRFGASDPRGDGITLGY